MLDTLTVYSEGVEGGRRLTLIKKKKAKQNNPEPP